MSCLRKADPAILIVPCRESLLRSASLFREQQAPWYQWTRRWDSMTMQDITDWDSMTTIDVRITNCAAKTSYPLEVRRFDPAPDDMIDQTWKEQGVAKFHTIAPYAIADMRKAAANLHQHIDESIGIYLIGFVGDSDQIFWDTFRAAFEWSSLAPVSVG